MMDFFFFVSLSLPGSCQRVDCMKTLAEGKTLMQDTFNKINGMIASE